MFSRFQLNRFISVIAATLAVAAPAVARAEGPVQVSGELSAATPYISSAVEISQGSDAELREEF